MTGTGGEDRRADVDALLRRVAAYLRNVSGMEVRRVDDHRVSIELVISRGDPEGRHWGVVRGELPIAWRWPDRDRLGEFVLGFVGVLVPLPAWPPPWPVWVGPSPEGPPLALKLLLQTARLPGVVPYAQVVYDEARGSCDASLVDAYLPGVTAAHRAQAERGLKLLQEHPGRIGSGRRRLEDEDWKGWRDDVRKAEKLKAQYPALSYDEIALHHIGIKPSLLKKYRARARQVGDG